MVWNGVSLPTSELHFERITDQYYLTLNSNFCIFLNDMWFCSQASETSQKCTNDNNNRFFFLSLQLEATIHVDSTNFPMPSVRVFFHFVISGVNLWLYSDARHHILEHSSSADRELCWVIVYNHLSVMNTIQCAYWLHACVRTMLQPHAQRPHCSSQGGNMLYREAWLCQQANKVSTVCAFECVSVLDCYKHSSPHWSSVAGAGKRRFLSAFNAAHSLAPFAAWCKSHWAELNNQRFSFPRGNWST